MQHQQRRNISLKNISGDKASLEIIDMMGRQLLGREINVVNKNETVQVQHRLPDGVYLVVVRNSAFNLKSPLTVQH